MGVGNHRNNRDGVSDMKNCTNCNLVAGVFVALDQHNHGRGDTIAYCVAHFVDADSTGQIPNHVGLELTAAAEKTLDGYFG